VSFDLAKKIRLGIREPITLREQIAPIISLSPDADDGVIEKTAVCAKLHSFYTEIEKILKLIARGYDGETPSSEAWHRQLLNQMTKGGVGSQKMYRAGMRRRRIRRFGDFNTVRHCAAILSHSVLSRMGWG
jgi:hypothetical protein